MSYTPPKRKFPLKKNFIFLLIIAILTCFSFYSLLKQFQKDPYTLPLLLMLILVGVVGFAIRQKHRLWYGVVEWTIGLLITAYPFLLTVLKLKSGIAIDIKGTLFDLKWASEISGIYFIIRGLDNIGKGLKVSQNIAVQHNRVIENNWHDLVALEAQRLWIERGRLSATTDLDWSEAELNVYRRKKFTPFADLWGKYIGYD